MTLRLVYINFRISSSMSGCICTVSNLGLYRLYGMPSGEMRNFSKFHEMSLRWTGCQTINLGLPTRWCELSEGAGMDSRRNCQRGSVLLPFISTLLKTGNFGSKPFPGRTCFRMLRSSWSFPVSWKINMKVWAFHMMFVIARILNWRSEIRNSRGSCTQLQ